MFLNGRKLIDKSISLMSSYNANIIKKSFIRIISIENNKEQFGFSYSPNLLITKEKIDQNRKINFIFNKTHIKFNDSSHFNKVIRKFKSDKLKINFQNRTFTNNNQEEKFLIRKRKQNVTKTLNKKDFTPQGNAIINIFNKSPVLLDQPATEDKDKTKSLETFNKEKQLYNEMITFLSEGKLSEAAKRISQIIELFYSQEKDNDNDNNNNKNNNSNIEEANQKLSILENPKIKNPIILKKIQIYTITLGDIYTILEKTNDSEFHLKNAIYLMEANPAHLIDQDKLLLIKLKERLFTSYLSKDEYDFFNEKLNEECEKLINSNIIFLEEKAASPQIEKQKNLFLNLQKMLLENLHYLAIALRKANKLKEANEALSKYITVKNRNPVLSQHTINVEYSVHLNFAINFLSLNELENSIKYFNLALGYLKDESKENFVAAKIMIIEKLCDIYEEQADASKVMDYLEEKKRLTIVLINLKTNSVKEFLEKSNNATLSNQIIHNDNINDDKNKHSNKASEIKNEIAAENENKISEKNEKEKEQALKCNPLFVDFEDFALKKDYLSLAKIYEELIELILENELQAEKFEEYLCEAEKYYNLLQKEEVFAANLNFILYIKNFDDAKYEAASLYGQKILKALEAFEAKITFILNPEYFEGLKDHEIQFLQINEDFYDLPVNERKAYLLKKFTNFDFYSFETKFKFYFYLSKIHKALNNQEEKAKYQNLALKEYEDLNKENKNKDNDKENINNQNNNENNNSNKEISVFHLIDLMSIYENKRFAEKFYSVFDLILSKIKAGEFAFLKKDDKELYTKSLYDVFFMKINYLIFEEKFQEAKETLKVLDRYPLGDEDIKFTEEQRDDLNKTLNLLDLKLKYIK